MATVRRFILVIAIGLLMTSCTVPAAVTAIPTALPTGTPVPDTAVPAARPTATLVIPPNLDLTEAPGPSITAGQLMFQFTTPRGFYLQDKPNGLLMENGEKNIMISLEQLSHQGKTSAAGFLQGFFQESIYNPIGTAESLEVAGRPGWVANVEAPGVYENGVGQIIVTDIDMDTLFYAVGLAKGDVWEASGKKIFQEVIDSVTFPAPK